MIFIPGNVPSLKNSKVVTMNGLFPSKTVTNYLRSLGIQSYSVTKKEVKGYVRKDNEFQKYCDILKPQIELSGYPIVMGFHFVRKSKHKFDFGNACQIVQDLMVAHKLIEDDSMDYLIPVPIWKDNQAYTYDKDSPGVYIKILHNFKIE